MMARLPRAALHALWILFLSYTANEVMAAGHVQEFACFTDYDKELVCHWKVPGQTNCSEEFLLYYRMELTSVTNDICIPENEEGGSRCSCTIHPEFFASGLTYVLALQHNGTDMWNYSITPALVVKPKAPKNLTIEKVENGNFNLSWEDSYSPPSVLSGHAVIYEVKYWRKQHPTEFSVKAINYQAKSFEIAASSLRRGYDYVASIRCNYTDYPAYWSEWSEEVEFHYDYHVTAEDVLQMAVPVACLLILAVSVICYFCFTKVKKEWWDQIPNPAKSHLVVKNVKFSVLSYIDEIKFPFHDLKQSHMENKISCKNCLARSLSSQNFKGKDNIRNVEKPCSCHSKSGEWFLKGSSAVLTPETVMVEESIEICERLADIEAESQDETSNQTTTFEPCESSFRAFREHAEHNDALASMFIELLADENSIQDEKDPHVNTGENKTIEKLESEDPSQQNPKESAALEESFRFGCQSSGINSTSLNARDLQHTVQQSLFPCNSENQHDSCVLIQESLNRPSLGTGKDRISNTVHKSFGTDVSSSTGLFSSAYKSFDTLTSPSTEPCGSAYKNFDTLTSPSTEPCGSAYKSFDALASPSTEPCGSAYKSFDALASPSTEPCGSAYKSFDALASPSTEPCGSAYKSFDALASPSMEPCGSAYKSFYTLTSPSVEPCGSAYKSFDALTSPSMERCGSAYKSFDALTSPSTEPCGSAYKSFDILVPAFKEPSREVYKSFDALVSQSMANSSPTPCFENVCSSPHLVQFSGTPEPGCRDQICHPPSDQICYTSCRSPCAELDFISLSTHANDCASTFLPEGEIHKQVIYQNVQKKASITPCSAGPQPSGYQSFCNAVKRDGTYGDNDEVIFRSLYELFIHLLYSSLRETPPDAITCEPDQRRGDHARLVVPGFDCSIVPGLAASDDVAQTGHGSLWIIHSNELSRDSRDENASSGKQLLHLLELNCQNLYSGESTIRGSKPDSCNYAGKGVQESNSNSLNPRFHCHTHKHLRKLENAGENKEVMKHPLGRRCGSVGSSLEESLDSVGLNTESETVELLELLGSDKPLAPLFVQNSCPSDSFTIHREGSRLASADKARSVELWRENIGESEKRAKLVQALAQEDNCYMKVA
ncbi:interleukin-4 receptor subunit alpha isoform X2 [Phaenicophaeus curvirostris]|uniref:interleukin-4 receptor subunit alpha isoform X2 n=1 Tax=Phaenicophaeus curvirostris TaxID=33595 RepID=UPI0037F0BEFB